MSPEELAKTPLKKGDHVHHELLGHCFYVSKVRNQKDMVVIETLDKINILGNFKESRRKVHISTLSYGGSKAAKKQPTNLILCHCESCGLKMRVARKWLSYPPACWNPQCETWQDGAKRGADMVVEFNDDFDPNARVEKMPGEVKNNPGVLGIDRSERIKRQNEEVYGTYHEGETGRQGGAKPVDYIPGKEGEDDIL